MKTPQEKRPVTRAEKRRAAIILVEIIVLLLAVFLQNMQATQVSADVPVTMNADPVVETVYMSPVVDRIVQVYALEDNLYLRDTHNPETDAYLLPLSGQLLWSGASRYVIAADEIPTRHSEDDSLPEGAELVDSFIAAGLLRVTHLDSHHVRIDSADSELILMSYSAPVTISEPVPEAMALCAMTNYRHGIESGKNYYLINVESGEITYLLNTDIKIEVETERFEGVVRYDENVELPRACGEPLVVFYTTEALGSIRTSSISATLAFGDDGIIRLTDQRYTKSNYSDYGFSGCSGRGYGGH